MKNPQFKHIRRIAILRTDRIGEVILSTPVIEALKRRFPQAEISFITSPYAREIVADRPDIAEVITFDTIERKVSLWEAFALSSILRKRNFDMAVILNPHKALHLAVFLAGICYRVGFDKKRGFLLNYRIKDKRQEGKLHELNYNLGLLETIGIKEKDIPPFINVSTRDSYYIKGLFEQFGIAPSKKIIIIHPGTSNPAKMWPAQYFKELINKLTATGNFNIIVIGDRSEKQLCEKIVSETNNKALNLAGLFTLKQLAALLKEANLFISNDAGPMHMAAALKKRVIAIFGRNIPGVSPTRWGPYGVDHIIFHKDPGCSPCLDRDCPYNFKCLTNITPDEVFNAAIKILQ
jgi:heptosyltransferase-2